MTLPSHVPSLHPEGSIRGFSGRCIDPFKITPKDIDPVDIITGLAGIARYNGLTYYPYWVGQHCVLLHDWARDAGYPLDIQRWFLLHDATEIYVSDMPRPIKRQPVMYRIMKPLEKKIMLAVSERFGLSRIQPDIIDEMDYDIVYSEKMALQPYGYLDAEQYWPNGPRHKFVIERWSFEKTQMEFHLRMRSHFGESCGLPA